MFRSIYPPTPSPPRLLWRKSSLVLQRQLALKSFALRLKAAGWKAGNDQSARLAKNLQRQSDFVILVSNGRPGGLVEPRRVLAHHALGREPRRHCLDRTGHVLEPGLGRAVLV